MSLTLSVCTCVVMSNRTTSTLPMLRSVIDFPMFSEDDDTSYQRIQYINKDETDGLLCIIAYKNKPYVFTCVTTSQTFNITDRSIIPYPAARYDNDEFSDILPLTLKEKNITLYSCDNGPR